MGTVDLKKLLLGTSLFISASAFAVATPAYAQETSDDDAVEVIEEDEAEENADSGDTVVVTGSRIKRNSFNSISPLQVISGEISRDIGLIDPANILQESTVATGQQIDSTFQGFVLDNGPGSSTLNLRGLGASRTLNLINGRRVAPAGVEGAPSTPDLNLLPGTLIERFDILLDGASSVYGSDAIAGVSNAILRTDFDGLELEFFGDASIYGGSNFTVSGAWGRNNDRGFFGVGGEYTQSSEVQLADRPFTDGCDTNYEIDENGQIRTVDLFDNFSLGQTTTPCKRTALAGRIIAGDFGSVYFDPSRDNGYLPNFSETSQFGVPVDIDANGVTDINFFDYSLNGQDLDASLFPKFSRFSIMGYGEYTFDGDKNLTPFFEALYSRRETEASGGPAQLFPNVPGLNPFNPCNPGAAGGVDCGLAYDALLTNPNFVQSFSDFFNDDTRNPQGTNNCFGLGNAGLCTPANFGLLSGPVGAIDVLPVISVRGDRSEVETELAQTRIVAGLRGDLPGLNWRSLNDFSFEVAATYSYSDGTSRRDGIREDRLNLALGSNDTDLSDGVATPCVDSSGMLDASVTAGCVPVNIFAPSLYANLRGDFATAAERNYLFDSRDFDTTYTQTVLSAFLTGDVFELPAGEVAIVLGAEYRIDDIDSQPDDIARDGLFFGFFSDGGARGDKSISEVYGEIELPLLANNTFASELTLNLSGRVTDDEFAAETAETYSAKLAWRPIDNVLIRATTGTSFRAPNLRELFLQNQSGFGNISDPCAVPLNAIDPLNGGYNPALDQRDQIILANCVAAGLDPTTLGAGGNGVFSTEIATGGSLTLTPETSDTYSIGIVYDQDLFDAFDLSVAVDYYDIEIANTVIQPGGQFIVNDCFVLQPNQTSTFCNRINRNADGTLNFIDGGFINRDQETASGVDINIIYQQELTLFQRPVDITVDVRANHVEERTTTFTNADGRTDFDTFQGEPGFPDWNGIATFRADFDNYRFTWSTRYIGETEQDSDFVDPFGNVTGDPATANTCLGPTLGDVNCRDVGFLEDYYVHSTSLFYRGETWTIGGGIRNVLDTDPPQVDGSEITAINNTPIGLGYNLNGRTFFLNVSKQF